MCLTIKHILFFWGNGQTLSPALSKTLSPLPRQGESLASLERLRADCFDPDNPSHMQKAKESSIVESSFTSSRTCGRGIYLLVATFWPRWI